MQIIRDVGALRKAVREMRRKHDRIALVPTMGALHDGHLALVAEGRRRADAVVASIFVNPTQFGPSEDLDAYPRREAEDARLLQAAGVEILWAPSAETMYPPGFATIVSAGRLGQVLCGAVRPGHFDGVATVVAKLFAQVAPDVALFGEKDFQQLAVIRRMATDLDIPVEIIGVPTVRADDGLALSSRNAYLDAAARSAASALPRALYEAADAIAAGREPEAAIARACDRILAAGFESVDYVELRDSSTLEPLARLDRPARLLAAARIGGARLIDNLPVNPPNQG